MLAVDAVGNALVLQLGHHERAGPGDHQQAALGGQVEEPHQVAVLAGLAGQVDLAVGVSWTSHGM